jgi:hypothetical protein
LNGRKRGGRSAKGIADPEKQNADLDSRNDNPNDKVNPPARVVEANQLESALARCHCVEHERD